jgi:phosphoglycolate phosphatase
MRTNTFGAVIFDMDGTLLDTIDDIADSMNEALSRMGFAGHPVNAYLAFVGDGIEALAERSLPGSERSAATVAEAVRIMREIYADRWSVKSRPYAGISDMLDGLSSRNIPMSILSNKLDGFTKAMAASLRARWRFVEDRGLLPGGLKTRPRRGMDAPVSWGWIPAAAYWWGQRHRHRRPPMRSGMAGFGALWGVHDGSVALPGGRRVIREVTAGLMGFFQETASGGRLEAAGGTRRR